LGIYNKGCLIVAKKYCSLEKTLRTLQGELYTYYDAYKRGELTQAEYLDKIKPLDYDIACIEIQILRTWLCKK